MTEWYHTLSWRILQNFYCTGLVKGFNVKYKFNCEEPEPPFFFLANHANFSDPFMIGNQINHPINFMANTTASGFRQRIGSAMIGVFSKKKGETDIAAVKKAINLIKKEHAVGIFPEGDRSWDGEVEPMMPTISSLVKRMGVPVVLANAKGNYISWPRWAETKRRGLVKVTYDLLSADDINAMSKEEIHEKISKTLYRNDLKDEEIMSVKFEGERLAEGIHFLFWECPKCGAHDTIRGEGDDIVCSECGPLYTLDANLRILNPDEKSGADIKDFLDWHKGRIKEAVDSADTESLLTKSTPVRIVELEGGDESEDFGNGTLSLYKDRIEFADTSSSKLLQFNINDVKYFADSFNKFFVFGAGRRRFKFFFNGKNASKWIFFLRYLKKL